MKAISNINKQIFPQAIFGILIVVFALGCERLDEDIEPATFPNTAEVFIDEFSAGLEYAAFGDSKVTAFSVDDKTSYEGTIGTSSMRFDVPNEGDPEGSYAGGVFRDLGGRNLTGYNALTFYAKASKSGTVNLIGFGNDFEEDKFSTTASIKISTSWNKYIIPIPDPSKLTQEKGLFVIAAAPEDGKGYSIWLDVVKYEKLGTLAHPRPAILNGEDVISRTYIGITTELTGLSQTMNLPNGADQTVNTTASFFSFSSTDTTVAKVDGLGNVSVIGEGTAKITGKLAGEDAAGSLTIVSLGEFTHAPIPDKDPANVISIFSDFYTNVPVDFYNGFFEPFQTTKGGADIVIDGDNIIRYTDLNFVATQFSQPTVDASEMTHLHIDIQVEDSIQDGDFIKLELVDFGADGAFGGNDDTGGSITFNSPPLETGKWVGLDILLADFDGLGSTSNLAQILFVSDATISTILVDNMYFYDNSGSSGPPIPPTTPAPDPTEPASNVISIYSDSYTDVPNEGFNQYGAATFEEVQISGNSSLKYTFSEGDGGNFQVIELGGDNQIDAEAAGMTNFRFDLWFPNEVGGSSAFLMKLVDIPGSGPTEALINVSPSSTPEMVQGSWLQFDIPFTELENNGLGGKSNIQQVVIDLLSSGEVYVDNIYFYKDGGSACEDPTVAPPTPTQDAADVISVFSDAYTDIANTNFNPNWGQTTVVTTENIAGESTLKYDVFNFQGTNLGGADGVDQDLSSMEYLHIDMWTCDATVVEVTPISRSTGEKPVSLTPISNGQWNSYDIPLSDFTGVSMADIYQMKFDGQQGTTPSKIFVDNIYFYRTGGSSTGPTEAAPTPPSRDAADVVSIYSDAYSDIAFDNFDAGWCGGAAVTGVTIAGDNVLKKNAGIDCHGIDFSSGRQDLSAFTHIHFDFYTDDTDLTGDVFNVKLVDFAGGGSEVTNLQVNINTGTTPAIVAGSWVSVDVDITALGGVVAGDLTRSDIAQIGITTANLTNVWYDNIYFYKDGGSACEDPTVAPPTPTQDAADVISVFSDAYTDIANTNFNPNWGQTTVVTTESIAGESTLKYDVFNFQGTNLGGADGVDQDLSSMEYLHIDMWTCDATVVEVTPISRSTGEKPVSLTPISNGQWNSYDIPLSDFTGVSMADIYQMKFDGQQGTTPSKIFVDNIYFYRTGGSSTGPTEAAPTPPSRDAADVVSIYSDAYSDIAFDNFDAGWCGGAAVTGVTIAGDNVLKKNAGIDCHGIDFSSGRQDLSAFTHIHFDFYTDDTDLTGDVFNVKLVDFAGGGSEVTNLQVNINTGTTPAIVAGSWVSVDVDITALGGVVAGDLTRSDIAQIGITTANLTNVWYDNIYFYKDGGSACEDPTVAPPTPTQDAADVISVFSDAYTDIANTNFNPNWGQTTVVTTESIAGESTLKYDVFNFQGTNLGGADGVDQDLSSMEYLHIDMWTCDATVVEVTPISRSTGEKPVSLTPISNGQWNSYDIPLSDFTGVSMADIYQMKFDGQQGTTPSKIFVDNIYFYRTGGSSTGPTEAAPTPPSRDAADVVSIYSDAYSDIAFDNFDAGWCGGAAVTGVTIAGDNVLKKNAGIDCHGIDFSSGRQDLSAFTHIHFDFYTDDTDLTGDVFNVKLVDFAGGNGEVSALEVNINTGTVPGIEAGVWVSVDIDITALGGVVAGSLTRSDIAQIGITTANLTNVWYDNIYLYK